MWCWSRKLTSKHGAAGDLGSAASALVISNTLFIFQWLSGCVLSSVHARQTLCCGFLTCKCLKSMFSCQSVVPGLKEHWTSRCFLGAKNGSYRNEDGVSHLHFYALVQLFAGGRYGLCGAELKVPKLVLHSRNERDQRVRRLPVFSLWMQECFWRRLQESFPVIKT